MHKIIKAVRLITLITVYTQVLQINSDLQLLNGPKIILNVYDLIQQDSKHKRPCKVVKASDYIYTASNGAKHFAVCVKGLDEAAKVRYLFLVA